MPRSKKTPPSPQGDTAADPAPLSSTEGLTGFFTRNIPQERMKLLQEVHEALKEGARGMTQMKDDRKRPYTITLPDGTVTTFN